MDTNNSHDDKIREANKLREKIRGVKEIGGIRNKMEPSSFTQLRPLQWITYTSVLHPTEQLKFLAENYDNLLWEMTTDYSLI